MGRIAIKVKKAAEKSILQGHPWVYETSIIKENKAGNTGDLAIIFNQRENRFMALGLYDAASPIRVKILHSGSPAKFDYEFLKNKIHNALDSRRALLNTDTDAYRLVYGENDGLPSLIIDIYGKNAVVKLYSAIWLNYLTWIYRTLVEEMHVDAIVLRLNRMLQSQKLSVSDGTVVYGLLENEVIPFKEHGLTFVANLIEGHKTGYFLDHRHNRLNIRKYANDKNVLDVFAYTGGFTTNAFMGGAKQVTSVDISGKALNVAKSNVQLNFEKANHITIQGDAFEVMNRLSSEKKQYGLIIIDPPSFAKREDEVKKAIYHYKRLVALVSQIIEPGGVLMMASCSSRLTKDDFYNVVTEEIDKVSRDYQVLEKMGHDIDHPEGIPQLSYLKSIYIRFGKN